jgi:phosphoglycolate phosphatase-like HAD superfamily hydrolase
MCYKLNVKSNETLLIGDRTSDVVAANLANCQSVFFYRKNLDVKSPTPMGNLLDIEVPKFSISSLVEVLGIVHESKSKAHLRVGSQ